MELTPNNTNLLNVTNGDFELVGYDPHPLIKAPVAV
jgi:thymidylate synthase